MRSLPSGPWEVLFQRALRLVDDLQHHGGLADPFWTLGGGTVLMFRYGHRLSKDIDIFVPDPQYLGYVTPRLSDTAASLTEDYTEMPGSFVKAAIRGRRGRLRSSPQSDGFGLGAVGDPGAASARGDCCGGHCQEDVPPRGPSHGSRSVRPGHGGRTGARRAGGSRTISHATPTSVSGTDRTTRGRVRGDLRGNRRDWVSPEPRALCRGRHCSSKDVPRAGLRGDNARCPSGEWLNFQRCTRSSNPTATN